MTKGEPKGKEFAEHLNAQSARLAAEDSRRLALPQTPEAYKIELPADFKAPQGIDFKFDDADPLLAQARGVMHDIDQGKLSGQEAFSKLLGLYAGAQVNSEAEVQTARAAEMAKLGPTSTARVTAIETFFSAVLGSAEDGKAVSSRMFTAADVARMEKVVAKFASQGTASFSQQHRDHSVNKVTPEQYEKMSYSERKDYATQHSNGKAA